MAETLILESGNHEKIQDRVNVDLDKWSDGKMDDLRQEHPEWTGARIENKMNSPEIQNKGLQIDTSPTDTNRSVVDSPRGEGRHVFVSAGLVSI